MSDNPLSSKVELDTTNYKAGIQDMNRQIRIIESGFKAVAASMGDWDKSSSGLEARISALTKQIGVQQQKVSGLQGVYKELAASGKTSQRELDLLQITINKETETLNRMQSEVKQSNSSLAAMGKEAQGAGNKTSELKKHEDSAVASTDHLGNALRGLGTHISNAAAGIGGLITKLGQLAVKLAIGVAGAATAAAVAIGGLAASTIGPASDLNETISKVGVVFGKSAAEVLKFGQQSATSLGMSTNAALAAAGTYGNLFNSMGMTNTESADMSMGLVQLAADLASFNNLDPTDVLDKLRAGLTGETEPLKSIVGNISAAEVEMQAMKMGLKKVNGEFSAASKAQATYALIMKLTTQAQGDQARTSGALAGQQRILTSQIENLRAKIGTALLPIVTRAAQALNNFLASPAVAAGVDKLTGWITRLSDSLGDVFIKLGTGNIQGAMNSLFGRDIVDRVMSFAKWVEQLTGKIGGLFTSFKQGGVSGLIKNLFSAPKEGDLAGSLGGMIGNMLTNLATKPEQLLQTGLSIINGLASSLTTAIPALLPAVMQLINSFVQFIVQSLPMLMSVGIQLVLTLINGILPMLPMLITTAIQLIVSLINGITSALPMLMAMIAKLIPQIVLVLIQNLPLLISAALQLIIALVQGLIVALPILVAAIPQILTAIVNALIIGLPMIFQAAQEIDQMLSKGMKSLLSVITNAAADLLNTIGARISAGASQLLQVGKNIVMGIWEGIKGMAGWFYGQVRDFFSGMIADVKEALGMHSPSKVFAGIGENIALGLGEGFGKSFQNVQRNINGAIDGLSSGFGNMNLAGGNLALQPAAAAAAPITVNVNATLNKPMDIYNLAYQIADVIQQRQNGG